MWGPRLEWQGASVWAEIQLERDKGVSGGRSRDGSRPGWPLMVPHRRANPGALNVAPTVDPELF